MDMSESSNRPLRVFLCHSSNEREKALGARVLRGGAFSKDARRARCAYRSNGDPTGGWDFIGFRVVIAPPITEIIKLSKE
jgi:formylglycine-generating enzyme required for sulfatase activity